MRGAFSSPRQTRRLGADVILSLLVVAVVALMVIPLPTWLLDILLASNLALSITILLVTLYVGTALEIAAFPSVLLITTLMRVSLNVASTRLILLQADAGVVIRSFGEFVVRGDFVVGAVVFLILTIVQFVVVAKGSERVAEVGARFSLDALPGKQMAIEAELRSGIIHAEQARARQRALERESHFYGAMDGAVKFVKGDVVSAILILFVNLVGGVAIGVGQRHLPVSTALRTYGVLTIGDGLVTQIPALLVATAAGILVTRVASDEKAPLGSELSSQLFGMPRALGVAGGVVTGLALVPGLPAIPFLAIGPALAAAAWLGRDAGRLKSQRLSDTQDSLAFEPAVVPWSFELSTDLFRTLTPRTLAEISDHVRETVFRERGVPLPPCRYSHDERLPDRHLVLSIQEVPASVVDVSENVPASSLVRHLKERLSPLLLSRAADFLGITETKLLLDRLDELSPATVRHVVPKVADIAVLTDVLRRLLEESVSIRDLTGILDALARAPESERDALSLTEHVRGELKRALTWDLTGGTSELSVVVLDSGIEDAVRAAVSKTTSGSYLALAPAAARDIVAAVQRALTNGNGVPSGSGVLLTRPDVRRFVRKLIETDLPEVRVVSHAELMPELVVKTKARARLGTALSD